MPTAIDEISETVGRYVAGMVRGDDQQIRQSFHPLTQAVGHLRGDMIWQSLDDFVADCRQKAAEADPDLTPCDIDALTVLGDTAFLRISFGWAGRRVQGSLSLLHGDDGWQIVSKVFLQLH